MAAVSAAWIQAHGHAQFFGWFGTFIIGISLYTLPKFRGSVCRSIPVAWVMWATWSVGVGLRWLGGVQTVVHPAEFRIASALELAVAVLLIWQVTPSGAKHRQGQAWEAPIFAGFTALLMLLVFQLWLTARTLASPALPAVSDRILISLAIWTFAFPVVAGYSGKFFPGLIGARPPHRTGIRLVLVLVLTAALGFALDSTVLAAVATSVAVALACWSLRVFHPKVGNPKTTGVYDLYPQFARLAYVWLAVSAILGFGVARPGMLGASRHAFTVGFLATLIFSIGPRILPSFLNSRELWSARLMQFSLVLITAGCALRVLAEPLAYGGIAGSAWKVLPVSAFAELAAVLLFGFNVAMSLATPIPAWFGRKHVNDRMSVYWLVSSYPATRKLLVENGLVTLSQAAAVPKSLSLRDAAEADKVPPDTLVQKLGDFFESRLPRSLRQSLQTSKPMNVRDCNQGRMGTEGDPSGVAMSAGAGPSQGGGARMTAAGRRMALVIPREHGAWGILLVPLSTGASVGLLAGGDGWGLVPFSIAALALFWLRTPVESWMGTTPVRPRTPDELRYVRNTALVLALVSMSALIWLFWGGQNRDLLWIGAAAGTAFAGQSILKRISRSARTAAQMVGAAGLTSTAPAAYYAVTGRLDATAWSLWVANLLFAINQIQFVQLRIRAAHTRNRSEKLSAGRSFLIGQVMLIMLLAVAGIGQLFPWFAALAFLPVLLRGFAWFAVKSEVLAIQTLGKSELFYACAFGVLLVLGMLLR